MPPPSASGVDRRLFLSSLLGAAAAAGLSGCAGSSAADTGVKGSTSAPLADKVPSGTSLKIASYQGVQQLQFKLAGLSDLPFKVADWPNISAPGPDVINAFRAKLARRRATTPASRRSRRTTRASTRRSSRCSVTRKPIYIFATKPGQRHPATGRTSRARRSAFSQGQAQGVVLLRALKEAGLKYNDVTLVAADQQPVPHRAAGGPGRRRAAGEPQSTKYLNQYGKDGATSVADRRRRPA